MAIGLVHDPVFLKHDPGSYHVESPQRLVGIDQALGQWEGYGDMRRMDLRPAQEEELLRVHHSEHLERVARTAGRAVSLDPDTSTSPDSFQVALDAAGSLIDLCDAALNGEVQGGMALIRPPGHHATPSRAMGFCLFNNVAVAAAHLVLARGLSRVMIIDWDVHHGNGTEEIFFADHRVLYFSVHQSPFYPGTGPLKSVGTGQGQGYTVNLPLPGGHDDYGYLRVFEDLVKPLGLAYEPQAIIVSAGFDAHREDPLGGMRLSSDGYGALTEVIMELAGQCCPGKVVMALEGGYSPQAMGRAVVAVLRGMNGATWPSLRQEAAAHQPPPTLEQALEITSRYWPVG